MSTRILSLLSLLALAAALSACGGSDASQDEIERARTEGAVEARQQAKIQRIEEQLKNLKHRRNGSQQTTTSSSTATAPPVTSSSGGSTSCGGDLSVGANTTCPFAQNVQSDYYSEIGSGSGTVVSYSPVTGKLYSMYCSAGSPHVCTGGTNASVYFP